MSIDVKLLLKVAKQALSNKHNKIVIEKCEEILQEDPKNYKALLLMAAAHQDTNVQAAIKYLRMATECSNDPTHAYQGLLKHAPNNEIPEIAAKLLKCAPSKYNEVHRKVELIASVTSLTNQCIEFLQNEITESKDEGRVRSAYFTLIDIYMNNTNIDKKWLELFQEAFEIAIVDRTFNNHVKVFIKYLKILNNLKRYELLLSKASEMLSIYPDEYIPLDMICRIYTEKFNETDNPFDEIVGADAIERYADQLLIMNEVSPNGLLAKGLHLFKTENFVAARDFLNKANSNSAFNAVCLKTLADTHLKLHAFTLAEYCYVTSKTENIDLVRCLVEQRNPIKCKEALWLTGTMHSTVADDVKPELIELEAKAFLHCGEVELAEQKIEELAGIKKRFISLRAYKFQCEENFEKALELLQSSVYHDAAYYLQLGQSLFSLKRYGEALNEFLKATRLEPYNSDCFHWLGKIYLLNGDSDRARKCFEKCIFLNPQHEQGVILLSAIYRQLAEWHLNAKILQTAAQAIPKKPCKWAELQLGFHSLEQNNFDDAINAFRNVLRMDPNNFSSWEGLADAYMKRGSFNSALKVYQKICELNEDNAYPRLQVANIRTTLKLFKEAIVSYEDLLNDFPDYLPALKGIADAHLGIARQYLEERLIGRSKVHAENAIRYLIKAIQLRSNFICLWRLLANCFDFIAALPISKAHVQVPGSLANVPDREFVEIRCDKLYELASRFYCRAIKINSADVSLWYELALNYYHRALRYGTIDTKKRFLDLAAEAAKHIIKESPTKWTYWNLLGVICATKEMNNLALAQHCFIKALELDKKLAIVWTNLGVLYLSQGPHVEKMANMAFTQAQQSQPSYENAWTGQAQIAETHDTFETIDLLAHSTSLGYNDESAIRYAYAICSLLQEIDSIGRYKRIQFYIEHLHVISSALDAITWYCNAKDVDVSAEALSFLGYLHYTQKNWRCATKAFEMATVKTKTIAQRDKILCNTAYCYLKSGRPSDAIKAFHDVTEATFRSTIGLAYSHFKAKQYESAYTSYESALDLLAKNDTEKSLILVALASMIYTFQGDEDAKLVLYQCIGLPNPPIEALLSSCALGVLHNDFQLSELVLKELKGFERDHLWCHHIAFLTSELYLKKSRPAKALRYLYSQIHSYPDKPLLRKVLANFLLHNSKKDEKHLTAANRMVEGTITMQRIDTKRQMSSLEAARLLALASEAMRCINLTASKKLAQKAFHVNPTCKEAWAARQLLCA